MNYKSSVAQFLVFCNCRQCFWLFIKVKDVNDIYIIDQLEMLQLMVVRFITNKQWNTWSVGDTSAGAVLKTGLKMFDLLWCIKYQMKTLLLLKKTDLSNPWDNYGTYILRFSRLDNKDKNHFSFVGYLIQTGCHSHSFKLLGWNIQDCCLLYQILIYKPVNSFNPFQLSFLNLLKCSKYLVEVNVYTVFSTVLWNTFFIGTQCLDFKGKHRFKGP
jgi:hypothetical protein